jgi:hypothetical protein
MVRRGVAILQNKVPLKSARPVNPFSRAAARPHGRDPARRSSWAAVVRDRVFQHSERFSPAVRVALGVRGS